ncbi:hypothetical protein [Variovorax paradoxus]|uniref:Uncharacterized protein n=1 Tax=Variovorax paradoxus (strain EPS) TaxID=595537 RepID=E6UXK7_VARPE|nr:hypothetical protein [Variovorax paradoxus]ADU39997.1 hypothetical protein Varpa_5845 [Variovorax paradoxus EPS]
MLKKTILVASFFMAHSFCLSQEISALKIDRKILKLSKNAGSLSCQVNLDFDGFRYSGDRQFLIFKQIKKGFYAPFYTDFIKLTDAYDQCKKSSRIRTLHDPAGENILDINAAGQIYMTYLEDMHHIGGGTLATRVSYAVRRLPGSKEIMFPFSVRKNESDEKAMQRIGRTGGMSSYEFGTAPDGIRLISKNGKYIAPAGIRCDEEKPYEDVWNVDTRRKISAKEIEALKRKNIQCEDLFD